MPLPMPRAAPVTNATRALSSYSGRLISPRVRLGPLEALPVAAPVEAHDPAEARGGEVSSRDKDLLALDAVHQGPACLARQLGVPVGPRHPVRLLELHRAVRGVSPHPRA